MNKTVVVYKLNGTTYSHTFDTRVSYGTVEQYLIMQKHIGRYSVNRAIVRITNML